MPAAPDDATIRGWFPVCRELAYFNAAAQAPLPLPVQEAVAAMAELQGRRGIAGYPEFRRTVDAARAAVARRVGAEPDEVAFVGGTGEALSRVAAGLDWRAGDRVVLADIEFPSNVYPWARLRDRGVELRFVRARDGLLPAERYVEACDARTRVVAVSHVQFSTGERIDLEALGAFCEERGILLVVDAIQSLGVVPVDVRRQRIGVLAAEGRKWLMAPTGTGILRVARPWIGRLLPQAVGAGSVEEGDDLRYRDAIDGAGGLDVEPLLRRDAGRFEPGFPNLTGLAGLEAALALAERIGVARIERAIADRVAQLVALLEEAGYAVHGPQSPERRAGIVSFAARTDPGRVAERLQAEGVSLSVRAGRLRLSPHVYNTEEETAAAVRRVVELDR